MRVVVLSIVVVAACGRVGFDANGDGPLDAMVPFVEATGTFDPGFGTGGTVVTASSESIRFFDLVGRGTGYVAIGTHLTTNSAARMGLFAYTATGQLDPTFSDDGIADIGPTGDSDYAYAAVRVDADRLAIAGDSDAGNGTRDDLTIGLVDELGSVVPGFGAGGFRRIDVGMAMHPDTANASTRLGSDLVVCGASNYDAADSRFAIARLDLSGALVPSWGTGGVVSDDFQTGVQDECIGLVAHPNGDVIAVGRSGDVIVVAAYTTGGARDTAFAGTGAVLLGTSAIAYGAAITGSDIIVAGESNGSAFVARVGPDGVLRAGFGSNGIVTLSAATIVTKVAVQPNGKLVFVGSSGSDGVVVRLLDDGSLDPAFGTGGVFTVGSPYEMLGLHLDPSGRLVVAGVVGTSEPFSSVIARID